MTTGKSFRHPQLDGVWVRLVNPHILEMRDPNDGQGFDPATKTRHQYIVLDGVLFGRRLPPEEIGDLWLGEVLPATWESTDPLPVECVLSAWREFHTSDSPPSHAAHLRLSQEPGHIIHVFRETIPAEADYACIIRGVEADDDGLAIRLDAYDWPQAGWCPDCDHVWVWAENGRVPGWRICQHCGSHWRVERTEAIRPVRLDYRHCELKSWIVRRGRLFL